MKAISLWEPWASAMRSGIKTIETRSWRTHYRGDLVICAAKKPLNLYRFEVARINCIPLVKERFGYAICVVELYNVLPTAHVDFGTDCDPKDESVEMNLGDFTPGRFAWFTRNLRVLDPVPVTGRQGLFNLPDAAAEEIRRQLQRQQPNKLK